MIIKEIKKDNAIIRFYDDCITSKEESKLLLQRAFENALRHIVSKSNKNTKIIN